MPGRSTSSGTERTREAWGRPDRLGAPRLAFARDAWHDRTILLSFGTDLFSLALSEPSLRFSMGHMDIRRRTISSRLVAAIIAAILLLPAFSETAPGICDSFPWWPGCQSLASTTLDSGPFDSDAQGLPS